MDKQRTHQNKTAAPTRLQQTKSSVKSPEHQEDDLQAVIGNRQMRLLMKTQIPIFSTMQGELPLLRGMRAVSPGRIQRQPLFRGLSFDLTADTATLALPSTGVQVQRKLTLDTPGDMYEQEADRVARQVVDEIHSFPFRESRPQRIEREQNTTRGKREAMVIRRKVWINPDQWLNGEQPTKLRLRRYFHEFDIFQQIMKVRENSPLSRVKIVDFHYDKYVESMIHAERNGGDVNSYQRALGHLNVLVRTINRTLRAIQPNTAAQSDYNNPNVSTWQTREQALHDLYEMRHPMEPLLPPLNPLLSLSW